jgi:hypothetical protein
VDLFERVTRLFEEELKVPHGNVCRLRCDARYKRPLLPWHIGDLYESDPLRLVIVGRPHRGDEPTVARPAGTHDGRATAERLFRTKPWPFWRYTREIMERVYGSPEEGWRRVVLTSIVKCTNAGPGAGGGDVTSRAMKESCIREAGVIREEMALLAPRTILLYTGRDYDEWVERLCWEYRQRWVDRGDRRDMVLCGNLPLPWWEGEITGGGVPVRVLRVGPPQGKPLADYTARVAGWIGRAP